MIWLFVPVLPRDIDPQVLGRNCGFLNGVEVFRARQAPGKFWTNAFPVAELALKLEDFAVDCFEFDTYTLVSERFRNAMALDPSEIQYLDVDAEQSARLPRAMKYKILNVPVVEEVSDRQNSSFINGPPSSKASEGVVLSTGKIAIRPDCAPEHELFSDRFFIGYWFCTDSLALRLLRAGCTGIRFYDPATFGIKGPNRFRTLRGLEEDAKWDPIRKIQHTKLIKEIP